MKGAAVSEESIEVRVARLEERDTSLWNTFDDIKKGIERIEKKIDGLQSWKEKTSGKMLALGSVLFIAATAAASWVVVIVTGKPGP